MSSMHVDTGLAQPAHVISLQSRGALGIHAEVGIVLIPAGCGILNNSSRCVDIHSLASRA